MESVATSSVSLLDLINLTHDVASLNAVYLTISVSAVLVLAGILFGVFYFFNLKPLQEKITKQEEKIDAQKKETDQVLKSAENKREESLEKFRDEHTEHIDELLAKNNEKNALETKNQIAASEKLLLEKIESISEDKNTKLKEVILSEATNKVSTSEKTLRKDISSLETSTNLLKENIKNNERKVKELELEEFARKNQMGAIYRAVDLLGEDIKNKSDYGISKSLERLEKQITGCLLDVGDITKIEDQLVKLDSEAKYKTLVEGVRAAVKKK